MSKRKKKIVRKAVLGVPVFQYTSACCSMPATKKACVVDSSVDFADRNKLEHSLGTWNCPSCKRKCKVTRAKARAEETKETNENS